MGVDELMLLFSILLVRFV